MLFVSEKNIVSENKINEFCFLPMKKYLQIFIISKFNLLNLDILILNKRWDVTLLSVFSSPPLSQIVTILLTTVPFKRDNISGQPFDVLDGASKLLERILSFL